MDWADRIADILEFGGEERDTVVSVAQELRKAKANGMREAASSIKTIVDQSRFQDGLAVTDAVDVVNARADAIEKGTE